jgi:hypothetical protein
MASERWPISSATKADREASLLYSVLTARRIIEATPFNEMAVGVLELGMIAVAAVTSDPARNALAAEWRQALAALARLPQAPTPRQRLEVLGRLARLNAELEAASPGMVRAWRPIQRVLEHERQTALKAADDGGTG